MELIGTFLLFGAIVAVVYFLTIRASNGLGEQVFSYAAKRTDEDLNNIEFSNLAYEIKFSHFRQLVRFSKGGEIRISSWESLGDTQAERARNLLLVRDNNIKLVVEATGEVIAPQTADAIANDLAIKK
jgi:hypothetical protein